MIKVAIEGLFAPVLDTGIARAEMDALDGELRTAHRELMSRRGRDVGFYDLPLRQDLPKMIAAEVSRLRALCDDLLVLGIGGSSLGGQALTSALGWTTDRSVRVHFADNVDPDTFGVLLERLDPARTAAVVITKSGHTVETVAQLLIVRRWLRVSLGQGEARSRMTFITDPEKGMLRELSRTEGVRAFDIPANVVGRYSVLSAVGLLPAAYLGVDIGKVLRGAAAMVERVSDDDVRRNPACVLAAGSVLAQRRLGRTSLVFMP
ncbi:MAG: glucose-6-phosphate isomerase, partial [Myxococcota bacterium]